MGQAVSVRRVAQPQGGTARSRIMLSPTRKSSPFFEVERLDSGVMVWIGRTWS